MTPAPMPSVPILSSLARLLALIVLVPFAIGGKGLKKLGRKLKVIR